MGLATAAMAGEGPAAPIVSAPAEPAAVARAIDEHQGAEAYDQVIVGYLLQIARELERRRGSPTRPSCAGGLDG